MFSKEDLEIGPVKDLVQFAPVAVFVGLVAPFLLLAYSLGFVLDKFGWYET